MKSKIQSLKSKVNFRRLLLRDLLVLSFTFYLLPFTFPNPVTAQIPEPAAPRSFSMPQPVEKTLPNGLRVIVAQTKNVPIVSVGLLVRSGGERDPKELAGLADFTASLLTKGTKTRSATQIAEEIEFLGGVIGSNSGWDSSGVTIRVTSDKVEKALTILSDVVLNPTFAQEEIDRYRDQLLDNLSLQMKQPGAIATNVSNKLAFGKYSIYSHPINGTPESVQRIKQSDLVKFHQDKYLADNAVIVFTGDISSETAFQLAEKYLSQMPKSVSSGIGTGSGSGAGSGSGINDIEKGKLQNIVVVDLPNSGQAAVQYVQPSLRRRSPNYYEANVLNSVLGGGYSSRLNQEVRIKRGLSYGAGSSFGMRRDGGIFRMSTQTKNESAGEVAELFIQELNKIGTSDLSENELTPRKSVLTGGFGRNVATTDGLAVTIGNLAVNYLPLSDINSYIQNTNAVTADAIKTFAAGNLTADKGVIVIVGDSKKFMDDLKKRFPSTNIRVILADKLDLESDNLEKK